jgi:hypothetical protein
MFHTPRARLLRRQRNRSDPDLNTTLDLHKTRKSFRPSPASQECRHNPNANTTVSSSTTGCVPVRMNALGVLARSEVSGLNRSTPCLLLRVASVPRNFAR